MATEFERKLYEEAATLDLSGLDPETRELFQGFYLPYSREVFAALAQSPAEVAEVGNPLAHKSSIFWGAGCQPRLGMTQHPPP